VCGVALLLSACGGAHRAPVGPVTAATAVDQRLITAATTAGGRIAGASAASPDIAWERLTELAAGIGNRITGSAALDAALAWAVRQMRHDGLDDVHLEPVKVPHWVRRAERA